MISVNWPPNPKADRPRPRAALIRRALEKETVKRSRRTTIELAVDAAKRGLPQVGAVVDDPRFDETIAWRYEQSHPLNVVRDDFIGHPLTDRTVVCVEVYGEECFKDEIEPILKQAHLRPVNRGHREEGMAVTFRSREDAALFRLFYSGATVVA